MKIVSLLHLISQIFTSTALGDVGLHFSVMLVRKANAAEEETIRDQRLYHYHNQRIHVTDGVTVLSLSASLLQKISLATGCLCQIF